MHAAGPTKKILITGAGGFIGRALYAALRPSSPHVRCALRSSASADALQLRPGETAIVGDIGPDTDWRDALAGIDTVIHLAARTHVMHQTGNPLEQYRRINVLGTTHLAHSAARAGVRRMVLLSSIKVNGESTGAAAFTEHDEPRPQDAYGITKWEAEQALREVAAANSLEAVVLRPPLVYGPGVKANFLRLMQAIDRGIPLPLAAIDNKRSLVYLGNLVEALTLCATHPAAAGETFLVSDGEDVSTPALVRLLARALGRPARLLPVPASLLRLLGRISGKTGAVARLTDSLQVDAAHLRNTLGWRPIASLPQGLAATARWYSTSVARASAAPEEAR